MPDAAPPSPATTSWHNANVKQQVISQLASGSLPAAGTEGRVYAVTDRDRLEIDNGSVLLPGPPWSSSGRVGGVWSRVANQSIPTGTSTFTAVSWDTETTDTDSFLTPHASTGTTITIPSNRGGIYMLTAQVSWASSPGANSSLGWLLGGVTSVNRTAIGAGTQMTAVGFTTTVALSATNTMQLVLSQGSGGAINVTASLQIWRLSA